MNLSARGHSRARRRARATCQPFERALSRSRSAAGTGASGANISASRGWQVFSALRHLGFRESAVKAVLRELRTDAEFAAATVERLLREALCRIRAMAG